MCVCVCLSILTPSHRSNCLNSRSEAQTSEELVTRMTKEQRPLPPPGGLGVLERSECVCVLMGCANKLSVVTVAISTSHCQKVAEQLSDFSGLSIHCSRQILPSFFILVDVVVIVPSLITSKQHYATYSSCIILNSLFACLMGCVV